MIEKLTSEQIEEVLNENLVGHLGCNDGFNTYVFPIHYVYDGKYIICHSQTGSKIRIMRQNRRVCFQVDEIKNAMNWKSVMVLGEYQELEDERDRYYAMKAFVDHMLRSKITVTDFLPHKEEQPGSFHSQENKRPVIYRLLIDEKTGCFELE